MISTFEQFVDECERERIGLDGQILDAAAQGMTNDPTLQGEQGWHYAPRNYPEYIAVAEAGRLLRIDPGSPLCEKPFDVRRLEGSSVGLRALGRILNASLFPVRYVGEDQEAEFASRSMSSLDTCEDTDERFAATFAQIIDPEPNNDHGYQLFYGRKRAMFIRKSFEVSSTISLREVIVNGIPYPEGSLFRAETLNDNFYDRWRIVQGRRIPSIPDGLTDVTRASNIHNKLAFLRMSAFALPPEERHTFGLAASNWDDKRARDMFAVSLPAIRKAIERARPY